MCFCGGGLSGDTGFTYRLLPTRRWRIVGSRAGGSECDEAHAPCLSSRFWGSLPRSQGLRPSRGPVPREKKRQPLVLWLVFADVAITKLKRFFPLEFEDTNPGISDNLRS